jgi:ethanolamine utilization protein EutN
LKVARVVGTLVSTVKHEDHHGTKLLWVRPVDDNGRPTEGAFIAIDGAQAGIGDYVLVMEEGKGARQVMDCKSAPCEAIIVGVVDHLTFRGARRILKPPEE